MMPTTRYRYVPVNRDAVVRAQADSRPDQGKITSAVLVHSVAVCWPDGHAELLYDVEAKADKVCAHFPGTPGRSDVRRCVAYADLAGVGMPYTSSSFSVIPMSGFDLGRCDASALRHAQPAGSPEG